jgi:DNA polymerase-3 subunit delta'
MIYGNINQQKVVKELINKNISPILISGPEGVGKFSFCLEYLQKVNLEKFIFSSDDKIIKIDVARFLVSLAQKKTDQRIVVIDEAHKFKGESQNTLLKTLEESSSNTVFILVTSQENKILPTIRSRSIKIKFGLVSDSETAKFLEEKGFDKEQIMLALDFYPYQPGKALKFLTDKDRLAILNKFLLGEINLNLKENFTLKEILEYYLLSKRKDLLKLLKQNKRSNNMVYHLRSALNLYYDADYNLNLDLQLTNLILNNG